MRTKLPSMIRILRTLSIILILALPVLSAHPAFAARIFEDGFETGDFSNWLPVVRTPSVTSGDAHHGTYKAVLASGQYAQERFASYSHYNQLFMRAYVQFKSFPFSGTESTIFGLWNYLLSRYMAEVRISNLGGTIVWRLRYYDNGSYHYANSGQQTNPSLNTWYCVEVEGVSNSATNAEARVYVNGIELTDITQTGKNNTAQMNSGYLWISGSPTIWYDCVVFDTAYIGPEDMSPPVFGTTTANTTLVGTPCDFDCLINDNVNVSTYIFSTNNTGSWTNDTAVAFSSFFNSTAAWANVTKTLNDTIGNVVSYMWYANDTSNIWSHSDLNNLITVTIPGDVTGDIWVDMQDISIIIDKFMATPTDPRWDPKCDVNGDLTIDMADISLTIHNFMQS